MRTKGKLCSIALASTFLVFVLLILLSNAVSAAQVTKIGNGYDPAIYENEVVWTNGGVIHLYNLNTKTDTTINSSAASNPDIYGNILVWHDESSGIPRLAVYDISTAAKSYITHDVDQYSRPAIYGSRIVWSTNYNESNNNYNVYMRDISTSTQTRITYGESPDIYDTKITYTYDDGYGRGISVYDITTKKTIGVYSSDPYWPHIYGNKVIWSDFYNRYGYISMYDIDTKERIDVTSDNTYSGDPNNPDAGADTGTHANINGDKIVYSKCTTDKFGSAGVYVYNISTWQSTQIFSYEDGVFTTPEVYDNIVVWGIDSNFYGANEYGNDIYVCDLVAKPAKPEAAFTANVASGAVPLTVLFTNTGTGGTPTSWNWSFGDGINSKHVETATHTFTNPGNYIITLTVGNTAGNSTVTKSNYIVVIDSATSDPAVIDPVITNPDALIVNFNSNVSEGYAPLTVQFNDSSRNATSRIWDFNNDGKTDSEEMNPVYTYTEPGTYTVNLTVSNAKDISSKTTSITVLTENGSSSDNNSSRGSSYSSSGSSHSSSRGSGSAGGGSPEPAKNVQVKEISQAFVTNGKPVKFDFSKNATCVVYVDFDAKKTAGKTTTIAEQLKGKSTLVSELDSGEIYKYFNLWVGNGGFATSSNIENPVVCFKVEKSWIQDKKIDQASIILNRYNEKKWAQLPVTLLREDNRYLYFTAKTSGFSFFAITGKPVETESRAKVKSETTTQPLEQNKTTAEAEPKTGAEQEPEKGKITSIPGFEMIFGIACLLMVFLHKIK